MKIKATIEVEIDAASPTEAADALDACAAKFRTYAIEVLDTNVQEA